MSDTVIITQPEAGKSQIRFIPEKEGKYIVTLIYTQDITGLLDALQAGLTGSKHLGDGLELLLVSTLEHDDRLQLLNLLVGETILTQFGIHIVDTNLIELIDSHGDIHDLIGSTDHLGDTSQDLAVVDLDLHTHTETGEHGVDDLHQFHLVEQRVRAHHIAIELIELTIAALLGTVGTPHGLHLIALEGQLQFLAVHHHIAGERHGEVVAQTFFADFGSQAERVALGQFAILNLRQVVARVQNLEEQFVALLAILTHQGLKGFLRRSLNLLESVEESQSAGIRRARTRYGWY